MKSRYANYFWKEGKKTKIKNDFAKDISMNINLSKAHLAK